MSLAIELGRRNLRFRDIAVGEEDSKVADEA